MKNPKKNLQKDNDKKKKAKEMPGRTAQEKKKGTKKPKLYKQGPKLQKKYDWKQTREKTLHSKKLGP